MRKLCRIRCNEHCHLFQVRKLSFINIFRVYSFFEIDALAWCSLGDLATHFLEKKVHLLVLSQSQMGTKKY